MTVDPDAQAFADAYLADPADDDTLDHHAARMVAQPAWLDVTDASIYLGWMTGYALVDGGDRDWLDVDAASLLYDLAVSLEHPAPDWRQFQEIVWISRLDDTLRNGVAW